MFGLNRWNSFDDVFNFQREVDRLFNQFWTELPFRSIAAPSSAIQVHTSEEGWRVDVPLPGVDPKDVSLEVSGNTLAVRAEMANENRDGNSTKYEQTITIPQFLDLEKLKASHNHGMLRMTLPLKESIKPRRIQIEMRPEDQKQLSAVS